MADDLDIIAIRVKDKCAVIVRVILGPQAGSAVVFSARCYGGSVEFVDLLAILGGKGPTARAP